MKFTASMKNRTAILPHLCERAAAAVIDGNGDPTNIDEANNIFLERDEAWNLYLTTRCGRRYDVPYLSGHHVGGRYFCGPIASAAAGAKRVGELVAYRLVGGGFPGAYDERRDVGVLA